MRKGYIMKKLIAIIGTREPTMEQSEHLRQTLRKLDPEQVIICSDLVDGIGVNALSLAKELRFQTFAVLPWESYQREYHIGLTGIKTLEEAPAELQRTAYESVAQHCEDPMQLSKGAWKMLATQYLTIHKASLVISYSTKETFTETVAHAKDIPLRQISPKGDVTNETHML